MIEYPRDGLYLGSVAHSRVRPGTNTFEYKAYFICAELGEIDRLIATSPLFSRNRFNVMSFYDADHGPRDGRPLRPWIEETLAKVGIDLSGGKIKLFVFPRVLGFRFYPVGFWYCFHNDGSLRAILAEVNNTFHQNHNYLLHARNKPLNWGDELQAEKVFYVSPFIPVSPVEYRFVFPEPFEHLQVRMDVFVESQLVLKAVLSAEWSELTTTSIAGTIIKYGPMSLRAKLLIIWQAVKIRAKGNRVIPRPEPPKDVTSL